MPLDAICLQAVVAELSPLVAGSRIEKIQQPARDQVVRLLRGSRRLLLSAGWGQPRLHLTELRRDNPAPVSYTHLYYMLRFQLHFTLSQLKDMF